MVFTSSLWKISERNIRRNVRFPLPWNIFIDRHMCSHWTFAVNFQGFNCGPESMMLEIWCFQFVEDNADRTDILWTVNFCVLLFIANGQKLPTYHTLFSSCQRTMRREWHRTWPNDVGREVVFVFHYRFCVCRRWKFISNKRISPTFPLNVIMCINLMPTRHRHIGARIYIHTRHTRTIGSRQFCYLIHEKHEYSVTENGMRHGMSSVSPVFRSQNSLHLQQFFASRRRSIFQFGLTVAERDWRRTTTYDDDVDNRWRSLLTAPVTALLLTFESHTKRLCNVNGETRDICAQKYNY